MTGTPPAQLEFYVQAGFSSIPDTVAVARTAEAEGFDGISVADHVFFPSTPVTTYPYTDDRTLPFSSEATCWPDPWVLIAALGSMTSSLRFLTRIYLLPLRNPLLVAHAGATAAAFAPGRIRLGIGVGWQREEFEALGQPFERRGNRTEESIRILRELWSSGKLSAFSGEHFSIGELTMNPIPPAPIPILIGGESDVARDRAARIGDGYVPMPNRNEELVAMVADMHDRLHHYEREVSQFEINVRSLDPMDPDGYRELAAVGVTSVCVAIIEMDASLEEKLEAIRHFNTRVIRPFRTTYRAKPYP